MKAIYRAPWFQAAAGWLAAGWLGFCLKTTRWSFENRDAAEAVWDAGGGVIVCFWHEEIAVSPPAWDYERGQEPRALISQSHDGEIFAQAVARLGIPPIRGSSAKKRADGGVKDKGGTEAFREILRWVKAGNCIAITPDGPRGPRRELAEGAIVLARLTKAPVLMLGIAAKPSIRLDTWDRSILPLPFARGVVVYGDPFVETGEDSEQVRAGWKARLDALADRAEALLA